VVFPEGEEDHRASEAEGSRKYFILGSGVANNFLEGGGGEVGKVAGQKSDLRVLKTQVCTIIIYKYRQSPTHIKRLCYFSNIIL